MGKVALIEKLKVIKPTQPISPPCQHPERTH